MGHVSIEGIPGTVSRRSFEPTGRWEVRRVWDSNWEKNVPAVVRPDGTLDHTYGGFPGSESFAEQFVADRRRSGE